MAQIDQYIKDAKQDDIGSEIADRAGQEAKSQAKKAGKAVSKRIQDRLGITALKNKVKVMTKKGVKAGAKAAFGAAKAGISALMSTPVGWVVIAATVIIGIVLISKMDADRRDRLIKEVSSDIIASEQEGSAVTETLTDEGVALLMADCPEVKRGSVSVEGGDVNATMEINADRKSVV